MEVYASLCRSIMGLKKFKNSNDIPEFPRYKSQEEYQQLIKEFIEAGAISKKDLVVGAWYFGSCRNSSIAQWVGNRFHYIREKFGTYFIEDINHFEDDDDYDLFIPIKRIKE